MIQNWVQQTRRHKVVFVQAFVVTLSLLVLCISIGLLCTISVLKIKETKKNLLVEGRLFF